MTRLGLAVACLVLLSACTAQRPADSGQAAAGSSSSGQQGRHSSQGAELVAESARTLRELRQGTPEQILDYALEDACAVIVLPGVYQAGFMYSLHIGSGVLVTRDKQGGWGAPAFVSVGGAGYGVQIGVEKQRLVLVVLEREMLERILASGLSFDALAKYDLLGARGQTGPDSMTSRRPVQAFTDGVGLMAGVGFRGAVLTLNEGLTADYHGQDKGGAEAVLQTSSAPGMEVFDLWTALYVTLPKAQIQAR